MSAFVRSRAYQLVRFTQGLPKPDDFQLVETPLPALREGQVLVRNEYLSMDAALRVRMSPRKEPYLPPLHPGDELDGWAVGTVVQSRDPDFPEGASVYHAQGWRDFAVLNVRVPGWTAPRLIDSSAQAPLTTYLSALGPAGFTAWVGLHQVAKLRPEDVVYVSAAAGGTGSFVVQLARLNGNRVIGSAGTEQKVRYITDELGADEGFCYRDEDPSTALPRIAPAGIDVYFDMVGGTHLDAALESLREEGRAALCGAIGSYNATSGTAPGVHNLFRCVERGLTLKGFLARMYADYWKEFLDQVTPLVASGELRDHTNVHSGLEQAPEAFISMLAGHTLGKTIVEVQ